MARRLAMPDPASPLLRRLAAVMTWLGLSYIRNYTPAENSEMYRVCYRQAKTAVFYAAIAYWQISLLGGPVWRLLTDPKGEEERVKKAVKGGIGTKGSARGTSRFLSFRKS